VSSASAAGRAFVPARTAVNLSALKLRIRATNNVAKITNVMKLVASSKLKSVEEALNRGRVFGESILNAVALPEVTHAARDAKDEDAAKGIFLDDKRHLVTVITTDRGLCGAVNSSLSRALRRELNAAARAKSSVRVFVLGDKGRAQIARDYTPIMARTVDNCFDKDPIFPLAAAIASKIVREPYDVLTLWFNHYENQAKFHNTYKKIPQLANMPVGVLPPSLKGYDIEPENNEETLVNMQEYAVASAIYYAMLETTACEVRWRMCVLPLGLCRRVVTAALGNGCVCARRVAHTHARARWRARALARACHVQRARLQWRQRNTLQCLCVCSRSRRCDAVAAVPRMLYFFFM
jgi:ATP synthase F1 gamma subunit